VLIIWSDSLETIIPTCNDFEERVIKLLWRSRPSAINGTSTPGTLSPPPSVDGHDLSRIASRQTSFLRSPVGLGRVYGMSLDDPEFRSAIVDEKGKDKEESRTLEQVTIEGPLGVRDGNVIQEKTTWYGRKYYVQVDLENQRNGSKRPTKLYSPLYNGLAAAISIGQFLLPFESVLLN
jgi:hypothetical protein